MNNFLKGEKYSNSSTKLNWTKMKKKNKKNSLQCITKISNEVNYEQNISHLQ